MCHKIRCDGESWKLFGFQGELNKAKILKFFKIFYHIEFLDIYMKY